MPVSAEKTLDMTQNSLNTVRWRETPSAASGNQHPVRRLRGMFGAGGCQIQSLLISWEYHHEIGDLDDEDHLRICTSRSEADRIIA